MPKGYLLGRVYINFRLSKQLICFYSSKYRANLEYNKILHIQLDLWQENYILSDKSKYFNI